MFAMKWFYADNGLKTRTTPTNSSVTTENELLTFCYLNYLEANNYLKSTQRYLFGELAKSTKQTVYQEQVFLFLEMLKVFFPGGDSLVAPSLLKETEKAHSLGAADSNETSIRFLSRIFSMISFENAGINLS